jgi:hypothetical protein
MKFVPSSRPMQPRAKTAEMLLAAGIKGPVAILGVRGYYRDTMGVPGVNDRGIYDDAIFVFSSSCHVAFNANTDPSVHRNGIASLIPGHWIYKLGTHGLSKPAHLRYRALVQAAPVTVLRDGGKRETGWFGINIHRGSYRTTSSLGCQTIHPDQWAAFIALVEDQLGRFAQKYIPYLLTHGTY